MQVALTTYADAVFHCLLYLGGATDAQNEIVARAAVQRAVSAFWSQRQWGCFYKRGRIITNASYSTGTATYLLSSGAVARQLTLASGTWPTWAAEGTVFIDRIGYPVSARISGTVLQLQTALAPAADIATASSYNIAQESYPLPVDFGNCTEVVNVDRGIHIDQCSPGDFALQGIINTSPNCPHMFAITGDSRRYGSLCMSFYPAPDGVYTFDFSYRRQSRALSSHGAVPVVAYSDGKASIVSASTTVTGTGTAFTASMVGTVIRFSATPTSKVPTGQSGSSPFFVQRTVAAHVSPTSLTLDQVPGATLSGVPYAISDPVDLEAGAMLNYFLAEVEHQARLIRRTKPEDFEIDAYKKALMSAFEADSRYNGLRSIGGGPSGFTRVANLPYTP